MEQQQANTSDDASLVRAAERLSMSAAQACERRFMSEGERAAPSIPNPYKPGSAAATWWQRGRDAALSRTTEGQS